MKYTVEYSRTVTVRRFESLRIGMSVEGDTDKINPEDLLKQAQTFVDAECDHHQARLSRPMR